MLECSNAPLPSSLLRGAPAVNFGASLTLKHSPVSLPGKTVHLSQHYQFQGHLWGVERPQLCVLLVEEVKAATFVPPFPQNMNKREKVIMVVLHRFDFKIEIELFSHPGAKNRESC